MIGTSGGTITESSGASVIFPAGAIDSDTTFRIAVDSTGAPPVPADMGATGSIYMVTPHGGDFLEDVEVRIPAPAVTLQPNQLLRLAKGEPGGEWVILDETELVDGKLSTKVRDFSYFVPVVVSYLLPFVTAEPAPPLSFTSTLTCNGGTCVDVFGSNAVLYTAVGNQGQLPVGCSADTLSALVTNFGPRVVFDKSGGSYSSTISHTGQGNLSFEVGILCTFWHRYAKRDLTWIRSVTLPDMVVHRMPQQLDVVEGLSSSLDVFMAGTRHAGSGISMSVIPPTRDDRAVIDWQRSDDGGASWRVIAHSYQDEADPLPFVGGVQWRPWKVSHGFLATATDQGALIRVRACYLAPGSAGAPSCVTSAGTRINVLQQSALPAIGEQPRSVLIRANETANFSVTTSGLPAPTLRWQTRPANSTGAWTDVDAGLGATTANYTTAPRALSDNGAQYRVVATNAVGNVASAPVTVSVSDLDVAPSITTQPASLSVTSGGDAVFATVVRGTEALSYQWRFNGTNISGANSPILRLTGVTNANAGAYTLHASNSAGNVTSNAATLQVTAGTPAAVAPSIVTQPVSVVANAGNTATFAVGVDGTGPLSFQWRRDGVNVTGANNASLTFASVALPNAGAYSVVVSNSAGSVVSQSVTLDVLPSVGSTAPSITSQPSAVVVPAGGSATLAVGATGSGPLSYQWNFNGTAIPGSTLPVLSLANVGNPQVGDYSVTVTNSVSSITSQSAQLILLGAPVITQDPAAATAKEGDTATFSVAANGSGLLYQWLRNGAQIPGATEASYTTNTLVEANTGAVYSVMVYNGAGLVTSQGAVLTVVLPVLPADTSLASPAHAGGSSNHNAANPTLSADGRYVAFNSFATDLIAGFPQGPVGSERNHAYRRDLVSGTTTLINQTTSGGVSTHDAFQLKLSANGRYALFSSLAADLVPGDTNGSFDVFRRDIDEGITERLNLLPDGNQIEGAGNSNADLRLNISGDGRYVSFLSTHDVATGGTGAVNDGYYLYVRDVQSSFTRLVEAPQAPNQFLYVDMAENGEWLAYGIYDAQTDTVIITLYDIEAHDYSLPFSYIQGAFPGGSRPGLSVSANGRYIAFALNAPSITGSSSDQVVVVDRDNPGEATVVSTGENGIGNGNSGYPRISGDGRYVLFETIAQNLTDGQALSSRRFPMVRDRVAGVTHYASHRANGEPVWVSAFGGSTISGDGGTVAFTADYSEVVGGPPIMQIFTEARQ